MIKTIIFDADGIVIERKGIILPSEKFAQELKIPLEKILVFFNNELQLCTIGKGDVKDALKKYLPSWGYKKSPDEFLESWFKHDSVVNEQMIKNIKSLRGKGIKCYLATHKEKYRLEYIKNILGFDDIFDGIFSSNEIGYKKLHQEFWEKTYKQLGSPDKKSVLFWDDNIKNLEAAKKFGFLAELHTGFDDYKNKIKNYIN